MNRQALNLFHCIYYGLAAAAILYMVAESWNYGFFFTPFPAILTALLIVYSGAAVVSVFDMIKPVRWLGSPAAAGFLKTSLPRQLALLPSIVAFIYLGTSFLTVNCFDSSPASIQRAQALISLDGTLFGPKRAEQHMKRFAAKSVELHRFDVADTFLTQYLSSVREHDRGPETIADAVTRVVSNHIQLRASRSVHSQINADKPL